MKTQIKAVIETPEQIYIDQTNLVSFKCDISDRADMQYPSYGIISNTATLVFNDFYQTVLNYINSNILHSGINVRIYIFNNITNTETTLCNIKIQSLSYDNDNRQVTAILQDELEEWQSINVEKYKYVPLTDKEKPAKEIYDYLYNITINANYKMLSFQELDQLTQWILNNTIIKFPILESSNLWNEWDKLCQLCLLHIYKQSDTIICRYNNGN